MSDDKKKGDFAQWQREDKGGDQKQRDDRNEDSRTGNQNAEAAADPEGQVAGSSSASRSASA